MSHRADGYIYIDLNQFKINNEMATAGSALTLLIDCFVFDIFALANTVAFKMVVIRGKRSLSAIIQFDFKWYLHPSRQLFNPKRRKALIVNANRADKRCIGLANRVPTATL